MSEVNATPSGGPNRIIHIGCGLLGLGATIPFLHLQFQDSPIILVQRATGWWGGLEDNSYCILKNSAGFSRAYKVWKPGSPTELSNRFLTWQTDLSQSIGQAESILLIVPHLAYIASLLSLINDYERVLLSCSIGYKAQKHLAQILQTVPAKWNQLLLFEGSVARDWADGALKEKVKHIVVDRICWSLHPDNSNPPKREGSEPELPIRSCTCEARYASFSWCKSVGALKEKGAFHISPLANYGFGNESWLQVVPNIEEKAKEKRALVDATRVVLGILCARLLGAKNMKALGQYLASLHSYLQQEYPEWHQALDTYMRMRSILLAIERGDTPGTALTEEQKEHLLAVFEIYYHEARKAFKRLTQTEDSLERVISEDGLSKDVTTYREHIQDIFHQFDQNQAIIEANFINRRPNRVEIRALKEFLGDSFLFAMEWVATRNA